MQDMSHESSVRSNRPRVDFKNIRSGRSVTIIPLYHYHYHHNRISVISSMPSQLLSIYMDFGREKIAKSQHQAKAKQWIMLSCFLVISACACIVCVCPFFAKNHFLSCIVTVISHTIKTEVLRYTWFCGCSFLCHFSFLYSSSDVLASNGVLQTKFYIQQQSIRRKKNTHTHTHTTDTELKRRKKEQKHQQKNRVCNEIKILRASRSHI